MVSIDLVVKDAKLVIPRRGVVEGSLAVDEGRIVSVASDAQFFTADRVIDAKGKYVFPGVIDPHVHYGQKYPDYQLDFQGNVSSETFSAAIGGVTTIDIMHRVSPPTSSYLPFYDENKAKAEQNASTDFYFSWTVMDPLHVNELPTYVEKHGITSFKFLLGYKLADNQIRGRGDDGLLYLMMQAVARYNSNLLTMVHCENGEIISELTEIVKATGSDTLASWTECRPEICEEEAISRVTMMAKRFGLPVYIPHISSTEGVDVIRKSKAVGIKAHGETCVHYLVLDKESPIGSMGKINPPLRDERNINGLWQAIFDGTVDTIGSDNVSVPRQYKIGDIWSVGIGFPGSAAMFPLMLSEGFHKRGLPLQRIAELTSYNTAKIFDLYPRKGDLSVGSDADLVVVDLKKSVKLTAELLKSSTGFTVYEGMEVTGWPVMTILRGQVIVEDGERVARAGGGRYLRRPVAHVGAERARAAMR